MQAHAILLAAAATLLVSGCMDANAATIAGQGYASGSKTKSLDCGDGEGRIALGAQGAGSFSVKVTDGAGGTLFSDGSVSAGQDGQAQALRGQPGTWTLKVSTGFGYGGQYSVTLTC